MERVYGVLVDDDKGMKHLDSEDQLQVWKGTIKSITRQNNYELAMFLYRTVNRELEHENGHFHYEFNVHK